jgi:L-asparagine transporter-like permease
MNWNNWIRQFHRWVSIAFTVAVVINVIAMAEQQTAFWIGLLALVPLILLLITGLYMFVLPYMTRGRGERLDVNAMERQRV